MEVQYDNNFKLENYNDKFLWRYIDLHKLFDLLINKQLFFARFDQFEDGVEGLTGQGIALKAMTLGEPITKKTINPLFDDQTQDEIIKKYDDARTKYLELLSNCQETQFANCWYLGNRESIAMWKLYSKEDGVAIKFNARNLIDSVIKTAKSFTNSDFVVLYLGEVVYKNIWPIDFNETFENTFAGLKKDKSYSHESEFRFVVGLDLQKKGQHNKFALPIGELSAYEMEIITNPYMDDWKIKNLKSVLEKYGVKEYLRTSQMEIRRK